MPIHADELAQWLLQPRADPLHRAAAEIWRLRAELAILRRRLNLPLTPEENERNNRKDPP